MSTMEIRTLGRLDGVVQAPGSKSYTQRALVVASLAEGKTVLQNCLWSEDTKTLMKALRLLGAEAEVSDGQGIIRGTGGQIVNPGQTLYLGNNGTAARFLLAVVSLGHGEFRLSGDNRLSERPVKPLLTALRQCGAVYYCENQDGFLPAVIRAQGLCGGRMVFDDVESSQYISALLISAPYAKGGIEIELRGKVSSRPYLDLTCKVMEDFGVCVDRPSDLCFRVQPGQRYRGTSYLVEGDVSNASYFFLAAAIVHGSIRVTHVNPGTLQGDIGILSIMEQLGCNVVCGDHWIEVKGGALAPGTYVCDLGAMPDMVPTLAILSAVRPGKTIIRNVAHLRIKESNRLEVIVRELSKVGIRAYERSDGLVIEGGRPHGAEIETYNDHRIAMSFAVLGLVVPGVRIRNGSCVRKSFPGFWDEMARLYAEG